MKKFKKAIAAVGICSLMGSVLAGCAKEIPMGSSANDITGWSDNTGNSGADQPGAGEVDDNDNNTAKDGNSVDNDNIKDGAWLNANIKDLTEQVPSAVYDYVQAPEFDGVQKFSKNLFAESMGETNPVLSPVSAYLALSLAGTGAKGETAKEFEAVLGGNLQAVAERLMDTLPTDTEGSQVLLSNSAWVDDRMNCEESWLAVAANSYSAQVYQTRLSSADAMNGINGWVEDHTKGMIKDFLAEPLDDDARLGLFNTVYFKGKWNYGFSAGSTHDQIFTKAGGEEIMVPMMTQKKDDLSYVTGEDCDGIVLPYQDTNLVFVALKPTKGQDVRRMCESLTMEKIGSMVDGAQPQYVSLLLPKFRVTFDRKLNEDMIKMGLDSAFDEYLADFTGLGLTDQMEPLYIDIVRQKAVFIMDEEGTEAAAVTEVGMARVTSVMQERTPLQVHFDEPFLYMILDPETDVPLFMGIMDDPSLAQN